MLEIPTGILADLVRYKSVVVLGCFISGASFFIVLLNPEAYWSYVIWAILSAVCTTLNSGSMDAFLYDCVQSDVKEKYSQILGRISAIAMITQAVTILLGGYLADRLGFNALLILSGAGGLMQAAVLSTIHIQSVNQSGLTGQDRSAINQGITIMMASIKKLAFEPKVRVLLVFAMQGFVLSQIVNTVYQPFLADAGFQRDTHIALFSAIALILTGSSALVFGAVKHSLPDRTWFQFLLLGYTCSLIGMYWHASAMVCFMFFFVINGAADVFLMESINRNITAETRATVLSTQNQAGSILFALIAVWLGTAIDHFGINLLALLFGILTGLLSMYLVTRYHTYIAAD